MLMFVAATDHVVLGAGKTGYVLFRVWPRDCKYLMTLTDSFQMMCRNCPSWRRKWWVSAEVPVLMLLMQLVT